MNKTKERPISQPITVNIDKLSAMLSCGHATATVSYTHLTLPTILRV